MKKKCNSEYEGIDKAISMTEKSVLSNESTISKRTYGLSVGGLGLSFTVFSFLAGNHWDVNWVIISILLAIYVCVIFLDSLSVLLARSKAKDLFDFFRGARRRGEHLSNNTINDLIDIPNESIFKFSKTILVVLLINMVATLVYVIFLFTN